MARAVLLFLSLLLASAAAAIPTAVRTIPPGPTSETPVTLAVYSYCPATSRYTVQKSPGQILLIRKALGTCPSPPIESLDVYVPVGTLAAGTYRVSWIDEGMSEPQREVGVIHVRNAHSPVPFEIHPFTVRTNPAGLRLRIEPTAFEPICTTSDCSGTTVRVGGVVAANVRNESGAVTFDAPAHAAGLVDVVVERDGTTWTYPNALYYFDKPDTFAFERILFPVLFNAPGANGSDWRSEGVVSNPNAWFAENFNSLLSVVCITFPCGERLAPGEYQRVDGNYRSGVVLLVPRPEAPLLDFSLRIRDVSRQSEGFGTEVPVVREKDMYLNRELRLLDVPLDPRYRVKVRVYALHDVGQDTGILVRTLTADDGKLRSESRFQMSRNCAGDSCAWIPLYREFDLAPTTAGDRVVLAIQGPAGSLTWAFATVTNNATQQVTIVSPQ